MLAGGGEGLTRGRPHGAGPARLLQPSRGGAELADSRRVRPAAPYSAAHARTHLPPWPPPPAAARTKGAGAEPPQDPPPATQSRLGLLPSLEPPIEGPNEQQRRDLSL